MEDWAKILYLPPKKNVHCFDIEPMRGYYEYLRHPWERKKLQYPLQIC